MPHHGPQAPRALNRGVQSLKDAGNLKREFSVDFSAKAREREIGYIVRTPEPGPARSSAQIVIAIPGADPETLPIAMEVAQPAAFWQNPAYTTIFGAVIGYGFFILQQRYARAAEAKKKFEEKKIEKATELWKFFHNTYPPLKNDQNLSELDRVRNVRRTLLDESVYSLLPLDLARQLNDLCDAKMVSKSPLAELDRQFRSAFPEFMS